MTESPVWARSAPPRRPVLTREAIVAAAIEIGDTEGLAAVSIRKIATRLGVRAMSLYSHIERKEDLLDLMSDEVVKEIIIADDELPSGWREAITAITRKERAAILRHPWVVELAGRKTSVGPHKLRHIEQSLASLDGLGVDGLTALRVVSAVSHYLLGCVSREVIEAEIGLDQGARETLLLPYLRNLTAGGDFPHLTPLLQDDVQLYVNPEERFEQGLAWLLDGIEANLKTP